MLTSIDKQRKEINAFRVQRRSDLLLKKRGLEPSTCTDLRTLVNSFRSSKRDEAYNALCQLCARLSENPDAISAKFITIPNSVHSLVGLLIKSSGNGRLMVKALDLLVLLSLGGSRVCHAIAKFAGPYTLSWTSCELLHIVWRSVVLVSNLVCDSNTCAAELLVKQGVLPQVTLLLHHYDEQVAEAAFRAILGFLNSGTVDVCHFVREGGVVDAVRCALLESTLKARRCYGAFIYFHFTCFENSLASYSLLESLLPLAEQVCELHNLLEVGFMVAALRIFATTFCIHPSDYDGFLPEIRLRFLHLCKRLVASNILALQKETLWALCNFTAVAKDHCMDLLTFEDGSFLLDCLSTAANRPLDAIYAMLYFHIARNVSLYAHWQNENSALTMNDGLLWPAADIPGNVSQLVAYLRSLYVRRNGFSSDVSSVDDQQWALTAGRKL
ncbi:hypothetical protein TTRE_0000189801 [Trichuris trichiura]|uniref:Uncharacterized protein n=1 Tax=Trichuris trichiura TaxID=36087 RepID=A0A077Z1U9_TRITR|nr:hypothetical protein TTRE_0000189801 [Trichuris trichiura]